MFLKTKWISPRLVVAKKSSLFLGVLALFFLMFTVGKIHASSSDQDLKKEHANEPQWEEELMGVFEKLISISDLAVDDESLDVPDIHEIKIEQPYKLSEDVMKLFEFKKKLAQLYSENIVISEKRNYQLDLKILDRKEEGDFIFYELGKVINFAYIDLPQALSSEGEVVQVVVKKSEKEDLIEIVDFFVEKDFELREIKDKHYSLYQEYQKDKEAGSKEYELIRNIDLQKNYEKIEKEVLKMKQEESENLPPIPIAEVFRPDHVISVILLFRFFMM